MTRREKWCAVEEFPDYAVSDLGCIKRIVPDSRGLNLGRIIKPSTNLHGYLFVGLRLPKCKQKNRTVHSLVCRAFHGPPPTPSHEVAHGDGDQTNNRASNLRWATRKENFADRDAHGRTVRGDKHHSRSRPELAPRGEQHGCAKLTAADVIAIRAALPGQQRRLAVQFGVSQTQISDIRARKTWRHIEQPAAVSQAA